MKSERYGLIRTRNDERNQPDMLMASPGIHLVRFPSSIAIVCVSVSKSGEVTIESGATVYRYELTDKAILINEISCRPPSTYPQAWN